MPSYRKEERVMHVFLIIITTSPTASCYQNQYAVISPSSRLGLTRCDCLHLYRKARVLMALILSRGTTDKLFSIITNSKSDYQLAYSMVVWRELITYQLIYGFINKRQSSISMVHLSHPNKLNKLLNRRNHFVSDSLIKYLY